MYIKYLFNKLCSVTKILFSIHKERCRAEYFVLHENSDKSTFHLWTLLLFPLDSVLTYNILAEILVRVKFAVV